MRTLIKTTLLLLISYLSNGQVTTAQYNFMRLTDIKNIMFIPADNSVSFLLGNTTVDDGNGGAYRFNVSYPKAGYFDDWHVIRPSNLILANMDGAFIKINQDSIYTKAQANSRFVSLTGSYVNPSWITSLAYSKITGVPISKRQEPLSGTTNASGVVTFTFSSAFSVAPNVSAPNLGVGTTNKETIILTALSTTSATFKVEARTDVLGLLPSYSNVNGRAVDCLFTEK